MTGAGIQLAALMTPGLLTAGAVAMSVPVVIHILARRRYVRVRWAAMEFLLDAQRRQRRRLQLEEYLLLALRCLAMLLLGLLVARPFFAPQRVLGQTAGSARTERIIILDDSFSMQYVQAEGAAGAAADTPATEGDASTTFGDGGALTTTGGGGPLARPGQRADTAFRAAKEAARTLLGMLSTHAPEDTVTILRASDVQEAVAAGVYLNPQQTSRLEERLEALTATERTLAPTTMVQDLARRLDEQSDEISVVLYVISDFRRVDWVTGPGTYPGDAGSPAPGATSGSAQGSRAGPTTATGSGSASSASGPVTQAAAGTGLLAPLAAWADEGREVSLVLINVGSPEAPNLAVADLALPDQRLVAGSEATLSIGVLNASPDAREDLSLEVSASQAAASSQSVALMPAFQSTRIRSRLVLPRSGAVPIRVALPADRLAVDNVRHLVAEVGDALRILVVNGEPGATVYEDEVELLVTALRPEGPVYSGNEITVVDDAGLEGRDLEAFHLVVLANAYRLSAPSVERLERYVGGGGGLLVFLGDQVDAEWYNEILFRQGSGLLPGQVGGRLEHQGGAGVRVVSPTHPALRALALEGDPLGLSRVSWNASYYVEPYVAPPADAPRAGAERDSSSDTDVDADAAVDAAQRQRFQSAEVLAVLTDADSDPAVIARPFGAGQVLLVTSSADQEWNRWASHPTYVPALLEMVRFVARRSTMQKDLLVGSPLEIPVDAARFERAVIVRTPAYPQEAEMSVTARESDGDGNRGWVAWWPEAKRPGIYRFLLRTREGGQEERLLAVNVDPRESDLTAATEADLRAALPELPIAYVESVEALSDLTQAARREYWRLVLVLLVVVLMAEQALAWWWGRRGAVGGSTLAAMPGGDRAVATLRSARRSAG
jgi:hypothetical protein